MQGEDHDFSLVTFAFGLLMAEVSWILYHWLIMYSFEGTGVIVPQMAVTQTLMAFVFARGYNSALRHDGKIKAKDIVMPAIFSGLVVVLMVLFFSKPVFNV